MADPGLLDAPPPPPATLGSSSGTISPEANIFTISPQYHRLVAKLRLARPRQGQICKGYDKSSQFSGAWKTFLTLAG